MNSTTLKSVETARDNLVHQHFGGFPFGIKRGHIDTDSGQAWFRIVDGHYKSYERNSDWLRWLNKIAEDGFKRDRRSYNPDSIAVKATVIEASLTDIQELQLASAANSRRQHPSTNALQFLGEVMAQDRTFEVAGIHVLGEQDKGVLILNGPESARDFLSATFPEG